MMEQLTSERDELIDGLRMNAEYQCRNEKFGTQKLLLKAADMLGADAAWYEKGDALLAAGFSPLFSVGQWWADRPWRKKT
jgi:hypothetical protein